MPISIAAAALYLAANLTNDKQIGKIKGFPDVPESAIKSRYDELSRELSKRDLLVRLAVHAHA